MNKPTHKTIRLLVVTQYYYPEQFRINDMCAEWVKRGYDVTVVTGIPNYPHGKFYKGYGWFRKKREVHEGVNIIRLPIISRGTSKVCLGLNYFSFVVSGFFWQLSTLQRADIVFSFEVSPMTQVLPAVWFANRRRIPCMVYIQDLWPDNFQEMTGVKDGFLVDLITRMTNYTYRQSKLILVTSYSFKKAIEDRGVPAEKVLFWPQYAEDFYKPTEEISALVMPDDRFTIVYTGNVGAAQGLEILPRTAAILKDIGVKTRFLIVGDGRGMPIIKKSITDERVEEYFCFIPQQPPREIPHILAGADAAFVSFADKPLFSMTIPAKLQSYMSCGMPIIAAAGGETRMIIEKTKCGLCCDPGDSSQLAACIVDFMDIYKTSAKMMSVNARSYSLAEYNKEKLLNDIDKYFLAVTQ